MLLLLTSQVFPFSPAAPLRADSAHHANPRGDDLFALVTHLLPRPSPHFRIHCSVTTFDSGCDGQVSIGPSSEPRRIPVSMVTIGLRNTGYSVNIRKNWKQEEMSSYLCELRSATTVTCPLATMRVSSAYHLTRKDVWLQGSGGSYRAVLAAIRISELPNQENRRNGYRKPAQWINCWGWRSREPAHSWGCLGSR